MAAVFLFVGARVVQGSAVFLMLGVSVILGALMQWIVTAKNKRQAVTRVLKAATLLASVYIMYDCGWMWDWLCYAI